MKISKEGCRAQMEKSERETFVIRWKYITQKLKMSGYDFTRVQIVKGKI